jgi:LmbE family N-acetylglucosaminyl deacetylase
LIVHNDLRYLHCFIMMKILGITAHPDDEAGAFGGSLLLYHDRGVETYVICLTPGQAATNRGGARSDEELASLRREEFFASCDILGVTGAWVLDYPDGGLAGIDFQTVVGDLVRRVRMIRPHIMVTLGTEGAITGHPDHAMTAIFATMAFHWAARKDRYPEQLNDRLAPHQTQKLYYCTAPFTLPDRPPVSPAPYTAAIDVNAYVKEKDRAFRTHATQAPLADKFSDAGRLFGGMEHFHLAAASRPAEMEKEDDLLAGVSE